MSTAETKSTTLTLEDLQAHTTRDDIWLLVSGKVYNVSKFLDEHPGGDEVILAEAGKDATEAFEDVGHSDEARDLLKDMYIGEFGGASKKSSYVHNASGDQKDNGGSNAVFLFPVALFGAILAYRFYFA